MFRSQHKRLAALNKFKAGERSILVATDVASRGLDIPSVDLVMNYDVPNNAKDYVHRVGRTARAGRSGRAVTFVTQYDVWVYQRIEDLLGKKLPAFPAEEETVLLNSLGQPYVVSEQSFVGDKEARMRTAAEPEIIKQIISQMFVRPYLREAADEIIAQIISQPNG